MVSISILLSNLSREVFRKRPLRCGVGPQIMSPTVAAKPEKHQDVFKPLSHCSPPIFWDPRTNVISSIFSQ